MLSTEKNGKTLHLLKSKSKPVPGGRKRKKLPVLGTFEQYAESKKKPAPVQGNDAKPKIQSQAASGSSILQFMAPPPSAGS